MDKEDFVNLNLRDFPREDRVKIRELKTKLKHLGFNWSLAGVVAFVVRYAYPEVMTKNKNQIHYELRKQKVL